jgi:hypothetical protein
VAQGRNGALAQRSPLTIPAKPVITLADVERRLRALELPEVDAVVAIERGGRVPGALVAAVLDRPLAALRISHRDDANLPSSDGPRLLARHEIPVSPGGRILLVDDVSVSGATLRCAQAELTAFTVHTLVLKGTAETVAFPEFDTCVSWPWSVERRVTPPADCRLSAVSPWRARGAAPPRPSARRT